MSDTEWTAERVVAELTPGMRMRILFDTAKAATGIAPDELEALFTEPSFEARMAAFCILDFQARRRPGDLELRDTYLRHHDRIDDWGMVDRAAPRVIGAPLAGGPYGLLHADPAPLVHKPVGIYLAYAGDRLPERLTEFLDQHGEAMPRAAYRIATRKRRAADHGALHDR